MSLCLNMIVKDESHIIEQTLENICQHFQLDYWVISDTGSSDNTIALIQQFFKNKAIQGEIHQTVWKNFAHNRNLALAKCRDKADYVLIFDADDQVDGTLILPPLQHDAYYLQMSNEAKTVKYLRKLIIKNDGQFHWKGVLHEFLDNPKEGKVEEIAGDYVVISGRKGHRSQDEQKYVKDARMLEQAFSAAEEPELLPRYAFYCAQSYRDAQLDEQAIQWYQKRIELQQGWFDERYCSYEQLGLLYEKQQNYKGALYAWQQGIALDPLRAECWYHSARRHSWNKHPALAYCFARQAAELTLPTGNRLFLKKDMYLYWGTYEWCLTSYQLGKLAESYQAFKRLVEHCPEDLAQRLLHQLKDYRHLILQDHFQDVQVLATHLQRLQMRDALENILNG